jgi:hypothetical protein
MEWLNRWSHRYDAAPTSPTPLERDPDLDRYHEAQHDLMSKTGYNADVLRESMRRRRWIDAQARSWQRDA